MSRDQLNAITLLLDIRRVAEELGRPSIVSEYERCGDHSKDTIYRRFDDWDNALRTADLNPANKRDLTQSSRISKEDLIDELQTAALALERPPTIEEMDDVGICSSGTFIRRFGSWRNALQAVPVQHPRYTTEELLESVLTAADELGHMPSTSEYDAH
jgi:hypothetical protein